MVDVDPGGRLARRHDRLLTWTATRAQILAGDIRAQRQHALHVVAVVFAERRAVG